MKNKIWKQTKMLCCILLNFLVFSINFQYVNAKEVNGFKEMRIIMNEQVITRSDIIKWVYKKENGKLYRRLYNYSQAKYMGDWEFVKNL